MVKTDIIASAFLFIAGLLAIFVIIPAQTTEGEELGLPPSMFPTVGAVVITVMAALMLISSLRRPKLEFDEVAPIQRPEWINLAVAAVVMLGSLGVMGYAGSQLDFMIGTGFLISGVLTVAVLMLYMGGRNLAVIVATSLAAPGVIYLAFWQLFRIPLP